MSQNDNKVSHLELMLETYYKAARHYDTGLAGAIGEAYAIEILGMEKAERGMKGIDGYINSRSVQVKCKETKSSYLTTQTYVAIRDSVRGLAQDLVLVFIGPDGQLDVIGPIAIDSIKNGYAHPKGETRYYLKDML